MADVETRSAIILLQIQRIRRETARARSVAIRVIVGVVAEERKFRSDPNTTVDDQLILLEGSFRLILENIALFWKRTPATRSVSCREERIEIIRVELVDAARVQVSHGDIRRLRKLPFQGDTGLNRIGRAQIVVDFTCSR